MWTCLRFIYLFIYCQYLRVTDAEMERWFMNGELKAMLKETTVA
jgi:hypothetical protein